MSPRSAIAETIVDLEGTTTKLVNALLVDRTDIRSALVQCIRFDGAEEPLPFELVIATLDQLSDLDDSIAQTFLSVAERLKLWSDRERLWLLYTRFKRLHSRTHGSGHWRQHAMPALLRIYSDPQADRTLKGIAAFHLAAEGSLEHLAPALVGVSVRSTAPGHYVTRLKLWCDRQIDFAPILPDCASDLADTWTRLGLSRFSDRISVAVLLALALNSSHPTATAGLLEDIRVWLPEVKSNISGSFIMTGLEALSRFPIDSKEPSRKEIHPLLPLLKAGCAATAYQESKSLPPVTTPNEIVWQAVLVAEAARRALSSGVALSELAVEESLLSQAEPKTRWAYHYIKSAIHWSRLEYHDALLDVEAARIQCGFLGEIKLLFTTHLLRQKIAGNLKLGELIEESDDVLAAIDRSNELSHLPLFIRELAFSHALGIDIEPPFYSASTLRIAAARAAAGETIESHEVKGLAELWQSLAKVKHEERFHCAQVTADIAQLMVKARIQWTNDLYARSLRPALEDAFRSALEIEAFQIVEHLERLVKASSLEFAKADLSAVLSSYEMPSFLPGPDRAGQYGIERIVRYVNCAHNTYERRWSLKAAYRAFSEHLDALTLPSVSQEHMSRLLAILQDLKQPSLESDGWLSDGSFQPQFDDYDDDPESESEVSVFCEDDVESHLAANDAVCIDFFVGKCNLYCFVLDSRNGHLHIDLLRIPVVGFKNDPRQLVNQWRGMFRSIVNPLGTMSEESDLHIAATRIDHELCRYGQIIPGSLRSSFQSDSRIVYVAPHLGLHGLPLHKLRAVDGWSLSESGRVLRIPRAKELSTLIIPHHSTGVQIICGPEQEFVCAEELLVEALSGTASKPKDRAELIEALCTHEFNVLLGHGWFDKDRPMQRSRIALDNGLRLTLQDLQDVKLQNSEIILLSCWNGWGTRSKLPIGEIFNAPTGWVKSGAAAVLAPLWPIPIEAGSKFVRDYILARIKGESRSSAYAAAQARSDMYAFGSLCSSAFCLWGTESN